MGVCGTKSSQLAVNSSLRPPTKLIKQSLKQHQAIARLLLGLLGQFWPVSQAGFVFGCSRVLSSHWWVFAVAMGCKIGNPGSGFFTHFKTTTRFWHFGTSYFHGRQTHLHADVFKPLYADTSFEDRSVKIHHQ